MRCHAHRDMPVYLFNEPIKFEEYHDEPLPESP